MKKIFALLLILYSLFPTGYGQENKVYDDMSLDELLDIDVVITASKQPEDLFEAPLSVTIIKREDIERSGARSIPEALRLAPGLIVREITPGNFDIHLRGYDDITKNIYISLPYNTTTLVMIDNRIVYNYFTGGTIWEAFPIDIIDVDQIEVVRGPVSALYGPNAVTGVINIITRHAKKTGMNASANASLGTIDAKNANASIGYNWKDKTKLTFSGNFAERYRFDNQYYDLTTNSYASFEDLHLSISPVKDENTLETWTFNEYREKLGISCDENLSLRRLGGNAFFSHYFSEQTSIDVSMGVQNSQSQKTGFLNLVTPLSQIKSESYTINARFKHKNLNGQFDVYSGQDYSAYKFNSYRFANIDANLEYFKQYEKLSFRPGISYKRARYNSPLTYQEPLRLSIFNYEFKDEHHITSTYSGSLLTEWKPASKLRLIGAIRVDKINTNKNLSINYEIASTYRINKDNLVRIASSRASRSAFIFDSYMNCNISLVFQYNDTGNVVPLYVPVEFNIKGSKNLKYPTIYSHEACWRKKFNPDLSLDVEVFYSMVKDLINPNVYRKTETVSQLLPTFQPDSLVSIKAEGNVIFENYDLKASQLGFSFSLEYKLSDKLEGRIFGTHQITNVTNGDAEFKRTKLEFTSLPDNRLLIIDESKSRPAQWNDELTPSFFGGFGLYYKPSHKWNFSVDGYYYSKQVFVNYDNYSMMGNTGLMSESQMIIRGNLVLNSKISYKIVDNLTSYLNCKNLLGEHREYGFADKIGRFFQIGLNWSLK